MSWPTTPDPLEILPREIFYPYPLDMEPIGSDDD